MTPVLNTKLQLLNRLGGRKELFSAVHGRNRVGVYVCGITPYATTHLGHAFTYVHFDVLVRYLRRLGYRVTYVQNLTDVDDDILRVAAEKKEDWRSYGEYNADLFLADMRWLGNQAPDIYPRATDMIPEMIAMAERLLVKRAAYERHGNVYFSVAAFPDFGKLSGLPRAQWLPTANQRGNKPDDPLKKDPLDFVLWQTSRPGEPAWASPWGPGRPGWHIECSVMAERFLDRPIDINGGGGDLAFPHHECSIAQSESDRETAFSRFWLHTGMVRYEGEKMSKSLGNMVFVKGLRSLGASVVRLAILAHAYGDIWTYHADDFNAARQTFDLFRQVRQRQSGPGNSFAIDDYRARFYATLNDNMNTPDALAVLKELARDCLSDSRRNISDAKAFLDEAHGILGLELGYGRT